MPLRKKACVFCFVLLSRPESQSINVQHVVFSVNRFESVHDDDLLGLHAIKTHFWEKDQPDVEVYLRRQTVEGEWIWLGAKVVSYIDSPVPGVIIHECTVQNEDVAVLVSRITRIASLLLQAVEAALFGVDVRNATRSGDDPVVAAGEQSDGAAEIQAMLSDASNKIGVNLSDSENPLRELMEAAGNDMRGLGPASGYPGDDEKKNADPLDYLKAGALLDLSKIILSEGEVKLVALILTGRLQVEDLGPLLYFALNSPQMDLVSATDEFYHLSEVQLRGNSTAQSPSEMIILKPPPLAVINLSYTKIGDHGMEALSEFIYSDNAALKTLDLSFCNISSQGLLSLCHGLKTRVVRGLPPLQALLLAGNTIQMDIAKQLGRSLSSDQVRHNQMRGDAGRGGLKLLHLGSTSISPTCLIVLLTGLGPMCPLQDLKLHSNKLGPGGASTLVSFLDTKSENGQLVLPELNRIDMSYNELGDKGVMNLTKAVSKRAKVSMKEVILSGNAMGSKGIESIMNKFLQHKLVTLKLDNNCIGDQGCQLVAASLPSIPSLSRLNLAFNDIGSRGIATLMRSLVGCESITNLGLSGKLCLA